MASHSLLSMSNRSFCSRSDLGWDSSISGGGDGLTLTLQSRLARMSRIGSVDLANIRRVIPMVEREEAEYYMDIEEYPPALRSSYKTKTAEAVAIWSADGKDSTVIPCFSSFEEQSVGSLNKPSRKLRQTNSADFLRMRREEYPLPPLGLKSVEDSSTTNPREHTPRIYLCDRNAPVARVQKIYSISYDGATSDQRSVNTAPNSQNRQSPDYTSYADEITRSIEINKNSPNSDFDFEATMANQVVASIRNQKPLDPPEKKHSVCRSARRSIHDHLMCAQRKPSSVHGAPEIPSLSTDHPLSARPFSTQDAHGTTVAKKEPWAPRAGARSPGVELRNRVTFLQEERERSRDGKSFSSTILADQAEPFASRDAPETWVSSKKEGRAVPSLLVERQSTVPTINVPDKQPGLPTRDAQRVPLAATNAPRELSSKKEAWGTRAATPPPELLSSSPSRYRQTTLNNGGSDGRSFVPVQAVISSKDPDGSKLVMLAKDPKPPMVTSPALCLPNSQRTVPKNARAPRNDPASLRILEANTKASLALSQRNKKKQEYHTGKNKSGEGLPSSQLTRVFLSDNKSTVEVTSGFGGLCTEQDETDPPRFPFVEEASWSTPECLMVCGGRRSVTQKDPMGGLVPDEQYLPDQQGACGHPTSVCSYCVEKEAVDRVSPQSWSLPFAAEETTSLPDSKTNKRNNNRASSQVQGAIDAVAAQCTSPLGLGGGSRHPVSDPCHTRKEGKRPTTIDEGGSLLMFDAGAKWHKAVAEILEPIESHHSTNEQRMQKATLAVANRCLVTYGDCRTAEQSGLEKNQSSLLGRGDLAVLEDDIEKNIDENLCTSDCPIAFRNLRMEKDKEREEENSFNVEASLTTALGSQPRRVAARPRNKPQPVVTNFIGYADERKSAAIAPLTSSSDEKFAFHEMDADNPKPPQKDYTEDPEQELPKTSVEEPSLPVGQRVSEILKVVGGSGGSHRHGTGMFVFEGQYLYLVENKNWSNHSAISDDTSISLSHNSGSTCDDNSIAMSDDDNDYSNTSNEFCSSYESLDSSSSGDDEETEDDASAEALVTDHSKLLVSQETIEEEDDVQVVDDDDEDGYEDVSSGLLEEEAFPIFTTIDELWALAEERGVLGGTRNTLEKSVWTLDEDVEDATSSSNSSSRSSTQEQHSQSTQNSNHGCPKEKRDFSWSLQERCRQRHDKRAVDAP